MFGFRFPSRASKFDFLRLHDCVVRFLHWCNSVVLRLQCSSFFAITCSNCSLMKSMGIKRINTRLWISYIFSGWYRGRNSQKRKKFYLISTKVLISRQWAFREMKSFLITKNLRCTMAEQRRFSFLYPFYTFTITIRWKNSLSVPLQLTALQFPLHVISYNIPQYM